MLSVRAPRSCGYLLALLFNQLPEQCYANNVHFMSGPFENPGTVATGTGIAPPTVRATASATIAMPRFVIYRAFAVAIRAASWRSCKQLLGKTEDFQRFDLPLVSKLQVRRKKKRQGHLRTIGEFQLVPVSHRANAPMFRLSDQPEKSANSEDGLPGKLDFMLPLFLAFH